MTTAAQQNLPEEPVASAANRSNGGLDTQSSHQNNVDIGKNLQEFKLADDISHIKGACTDCSFVEIFSGSCRLAKACRDVGFKVTAVDKDKSRAEFFTIYNCDLCDREQYRMLETYLTAIHKSLLHVHMAPACGTASRARDKPIPGVPKHQQPRPLRSEAFPDGLGNLSEVEQQRVWLANVSYEATAKLCLLLIKMNVSVSIENPEASFFWQTRHIKKLLQQIPGYITIFDSCMHGGSRAKGTTFWSFNPRDPQRNLFEQLAMRCDASHAHESWRPIQVQGRLRFPTASEASYPLLLCSRIAYILKDEAIRCGFVFPQSLQEQTTFDERVGKRQLFTKQPRNHTLKPLVSEFETYGSILIAASDRDGVDAFLKTLPRGSKVCNRRPISGGLSEDEVRNKFKHVDIGESWKSDVSAEVVHIGIPREPESFLREAIKTGHPRDFLARAPKEVKQLLDNFASDKMESRFAKRASFMKKWLKRSLELKQAEDELHQRLDEHLKPLLQRKRLLLWREILQDLQYPDCQVVDQIIKGFPLTGWAAKTYVFEKQTRRPEMTVEQLERMSAGLNAAVVGSLKKDEWTEVDDKVWEETQAELSRAWIATDESGPPKFVAKRFGLSQRNKTRMIDDFSCCGINAAFGLTEKLRVQSVDELCSYLAILLDDDRCDRQAPIVGRTFDLKAAYKQFGVDAYHAKNCGIAVKQPAGGVKTFLVRALPFGATGSVAGFLRIAASLTYIGLYGLDVIWTNFFDDYTAICRASEKRNVEFYVTALFRLLGITYADEGDKAPEFSETFHSLGLNFDLSSFSKGFFQLSHTDRRRQELCEAMGGLLQGKKCSPKVLESLHGRLVWFGSFVFGRKLNIFVRTISAFSTRAVRTVSIEGELEWALKGLIKAMESFKPAKIDRCICSTWLIFSDGALELVEGRPFASVGAVLVSPQGSIAEFFGLEVPPSLLGELLEDSKHPIYEIEILAALVALLEWSALVKASQVVIYIDNEACRSAFIQGVGATTHAKLLLSVFDDLECVNRLICWFGRVPSHSNISDKPSRLVFDDPILSGARHRNVQIPSHLMEVGLAAGVTES